MEMAADKPSNKGWLDCNYQLHKIYGEIDLCFNAYNMENT